MPRRGHSNDDLLFSHFSSSLRGWWVMFLFIYADIRAEYYAVSTSNAIATAPEAGLNSQLESPLV